MKIVIIASGSRGDVQPYIALSKGLSEAGHEIRFVSHENYADLIAKNGIDFFSIPGNVQNVAQSEELTSLLAKGKFLAMMKIMGEEAQKNALNLARVSQTASKNADLIIGGFGGLFIGIGIGEKFDIPVIPAYLVPFTPTKAFPSVLTPWMPKMIGPLVNKLSHRISRQVMWQSLRKADTSARKKVLGIDPAPFFGPYDASPVERMPTIYGYSIHVIPRPWDWPENVKIPGYWFLEPEVGWQPPIELVEFLESGQKPIYIGFGSMTSRDPKRITQLILDAVIKSNQRAILQSGWGGLQAEDLPESVMMVGSIPHSWLFPKMSAIVHHGGAGTTAAGLRAGVPNLVIPFFGDQPFWGQRLSELGVGPDPISIKKLSANSLSSSIEIMISDPDMASRARSLGEKIRDEKGVDNAVKIIERAFLNDESNSDTSLN